MTVWPKPRKRDPDPEICDCQELTQIDGSAHKYHPKDKNGRPTGHDPACEHYVPPATTPRSS